MQVLIAEDNNFHRKMLEGIVRDTGFDAVSVTNGDDAWNILQREDAPRIALLDWIMPGLNGLEVCQKAKTLSKSRQQYLIMVTARNESADIVAGLDGGANDYLTKPIDREVLLARLRVAARSLNADAPIKMERSTKCVIAYDAEPIKGYRLIEPLGEGGFGEVWKCLAPGGLFKAVKFVPGRKQAEQDEDRAQIELDALNHIKETRHPFLISIERVEVVSGRAVIVMELADKSLKDVLTAHQISGRLGIPRRELLGYLSDVAEALDHIGQDKGLLHLDIKPSNIFVVGSHAKLADFGQVRALEEWSNQDSAALTKALTPLYAAPELYNNLITEQSDQYSLAIVYQELLTGICPFEGKSARQLIWKHLSEEPNLTPLPRNDRKIVGKALSKSPNDRYTTCREFVSALAGSSF